MSASDKSRAEARFTKSAKTPTEKATSNERDAAAKAVRDNMAKLKALRLAREAANPTPTVTKPARAKGGKAGKTEKKETPALGEWLAGQQNGGRRT